MNKSELIEEISKTTEMTKKQAEIALKATLEVIKGELAKGGSVALIGFGSFVVRERAARNGRNPKTGETIKIAAATVPAFRPGSALKEAVNTKKGKK